MNPERAKELLQKLEKRRAKARRGWEYFELERRREETTRALNSTISEIESEHLFGDHEVTRKEEGNWVWVNTKKGRKPAT